MTNDRYRLCSATMWALWLLACVTGAAVPRAAPALEVAVNWPAFLAKHDLVWTSVPRRWEEGAFLGNGLIGAMVFTEGPRAIAWQLGRTDVIERRELADPVLGQGRLPIGRFTLETGGPITGADLRLRLWNAELTGTVTTDRGRIELRSFVHATEPLLMIEVTADEGERDARFAFHPDLSIVERRFFRKLSIAPEDINPPPFLVERDGVRVSVQRRRAGGEYAVGWRETSTGGVRRLFLSIDDSFPGPGARDRVASHVRRARSIEFTRLVETHRAYWHAYYPASFLSVPDAQLESFYWIQMYKLASATRARGLVIDNQGPWYRETPWPAIWWNLNVELTYWPVYAANRLALGESLLRFLERNEPRLRANVPEGVGGESMAISRASSLDGRSPIAEMPPSGPHQDGAVELSNLIWVMHNVWLHWRHAMDESLARDRLFPWLAASVTFVLDQLQEGPDGHLHLPLSLSPEYPEPAEDTNYDLALLRWGCRALVDLGERLDRQHPASDRCRTTLDRLVPYPAGANGYQIGRGVELGQSHRHFSHLLMIYPLREVTGHTPDERALIERSLAHWIGFEGALQGYSFVGAALISSMLGDGDRAAGHLRTLVTRFVHPNTMYTESGPVIETPLAAAQAVHELVLQSWGGRLRIFPAAPSAWRDAAFHDLRAEGAFLVSAVRRGGRTTAVRVTSLAGEPAVLETRLSSAEISAPAGAVSAVGPGLWQLRLAAGETATFVDSTAPPTDRVVAPVAADPAGDNPFGLR